LLPGPEGKGSFEVFDFPAKTQFTPGTVFAGVGKSNVEILRGEFLCGKGRCRATTHIVHWLSAFILMQMTFPAPNRLKYAVATSSNLLCGVVFCDGLK
jgi:hypothetical protein